MKYNGVCVCCRKEKGVAAFSPITGGPICRDCLPLRRDAVAFVIVPMPFDAIAPDGVWMRGLGEDGELDEVETEDLAEYQRPRLGTVSRCFNCGLPFRYSEDKFWIYDKLACTVCRNYYGKIELKERAASEAFGPRFHWRCGRPLVADTGDVPSDVERLFYK